MIDQAQGRAGNRGCFEQRMNWQFDIKYRADTADQSDGQQRMATEGKRSCRGGLCGRPAAQATPPSEY